MKNIDVGKIQVTPFEFIGIMEIKIEKALNKHSTLYVRGVVKADDEDSFVTDMTDNIKVKLTNDGQIYFSGVLKLVNITRVENVCYLEVFAVSNTVILDTVKYKRSFQDNDQKYKSIIETIIKGNRGSVSFNAPDLSVENIIIQYDETDWEFAKRLASHTQSVLIPISTSDTPEFSFGVTDKGSGKIDSNTYSISKDMEAYRLMSQGDQPFEDSDAIIYTVETDEFLYELGEKLTLNGKPLYIRNVLLKLEKSSLTCLYTLSPKNAISTPKIYNRAITGLVLDGKVLKAENDHVKLHLSIDEEQDEGKAHLFSYATSYSAEGHTGWYVMPEEGDTVQLLFPKEDEKYAVAVASVRQADSDRTVDPLVKYLRTPFGKEIKLQEKEILITAKDDETFIRINEDTGIEIITPNPIKITSGDTIDITSENDMTITTNKNLTITATDSIVMNCGGNNVTIKPPSGIAVSTDKQIKLNSDDNTSIDSKKDISVSSGKEMSVSSGTDMTVSSGKKLAESAQSGLELSCSGSSIKLDGNIDLKAKLIKEN